MVMTYETDVTHDVTTVTGRDMHQRVGDVSKGSKISLIHREYDSLHILTLTDKIEAVKEAVYGRLRGDVTSPRGHSNHQQHDKANQPPIRKMEFKVTEKTTVKIFSANITLLPLGAIVNAANSELTS